MEPTKYYLVSTIILQSSTCVYIILLSLKIQTQGNNLSTSNKDHPSSLAMVINYEKIF